MKVDRNGNVYGEGADEQLWILSPQGKHLGTIMVPEGFANMAFGDADGKTLYITGHNGLYRIRLKVPGKLP
jgi:sugar lactone lactonase YvrE